MERRKFIKNISVLGAAMLVLPSVAMAVTEEVCLVPIPTQEQIRHGLLSLAKPTSETKNWQESIQKNVFYKNGYTAGEGDLMLYSFVKNGEDYLLGIKGEELMLTINQQTSTHLLRENKLLYQSSTQNFELQIYQGDFELEKNSSYLFLPISDATRVNNYYIDQQFLKISNSNRVVLIDKPIIIIITKNQ